MVVVLIVRDGHDVAGGAVPVGKGGKVVLDAPPVDNAMDDPETEGVGKGPYGRVWMTRGRLVTLWLLVLWVPDRGLLLLVKVSKEVNAPVEAGKVWLPGGDVPVGMGREELYVRMEALGADESGG
jgi:hypothetical protein